MKGKVKQNARVCVKAGLVGEPWQNHSCRQAGKTRCERAVRNMYDVRIIHSPAPIRCPEFLNARAFEIAVSRAAMAVADLCWSREGLGFLVCLCVL